MADIKTLKITYANQSLELCTATNQNWTKTLETVEKRDQNTINRPVRTNLNKKQELIGIKNTN